MRRALASVLGGLVGGLLGAGVMSAGHALLAPSPRPVSASNEEDSTLKIAGRASEIVRGRPLAEREEPLAGHVVHYGFGASMGLLYGAAAVAAPVVTIGAGVGYGVAVWLGAHAIVVPALGLARSPLREPLGKEALELVLHLAYGLTLGLVHRGAVRISSGVYGAGPSAPCRRSPSGSARAKEAAETPPARPAPRDRHSNPRASDPRTEGQVQG